MYRRVVPLEFVLGKQALYYLAKAKNQIGITPQSIDKTLCSVDMMIPSVFKFYLS